MPIAAPLRLKGRTGRPSLCSTTTLSVASRATGIGYACALHFDFVVEQACSAAARVTSSTPSSCSSPPSCCSSSSLRGVISSREALYVRFAVLVYARALPVQGRSDVFPDCAEVLLWQSLNVCLRYCVFVPRGREVRLCFLVRDRVPQRTLRFDGLLHHQVHGNGSRFGDPRWLAFF